MREKLGCDSGPDGIQYRGTTVVEAPSWWQYYDGYVAGQNARSYFLFHERSGKVDVYTSEGALNGVIEHRGLRRIGWRRTGPYLWETPGFLFMMPVFWC